MLWKHFRQKFPQKFLEKNGIRNFLSMPNLKKFLQKFCEGPIWSTALNDTTTEENLIKNNADPQNKACSSTDLIKNKADPVNIAAIKKTQGLFTVNPFKASEEWTHKTPSSFWSRRTPLEFVWKSWHLRIPNWQKGHHSRISIQLDFSWGTSNSQVHPAIPVQPVTPLAAPLPVVQHPHPHWLKQNSRARKMKNLLTLLTSVLLWYSECHPLWI